MINNLKSNKQLWLLVAVLSLIASVTGVFYQDIYNEVISLEVLPGTISQDMITIIISIFLLILSITVNEKDRKKQIIALSLLAYLFYGYGIYVIEQIYNMYYILYIAIFTLSFWSLVYSLINLDQKILSNINVSKLIRYLNIGFSIFIPLLFYSIWISELLPLMKIGDKIEFTYSIYILDMVFVLPALLISAVLIIKNHGTGYIFASLLFFKAFTLLFSVGLGSLIRPLYDMPANYGLALYSSRYKKRLVSP